MIKMIIGFFIFCIILFLYLHIQFHLKTSNDLEIFEIEHNSKEIFEEICDFRQPVLFDNLSEQMQIVETTNKNHLLKNFPAFEVKIRDMNHIDDDKTDLYAPLTLQLTNALFEKDDNSNYFTENNSDFLQETCIIKTMRQYDEYLRPFLNSLSMYDIMMGSDKSVTPLRYNINYRNFFIVTQGTINVKLTPPKSSRYLQPIYDYENFEFKSYMNPWSNENINEFEKVKFLELTLVPGKCLYIPAYWWYSFQFSKDASVSCFYYRTYMNTISITPQLFMFFLQNQNVKRSIVKNKLQVNIPREKEETRNEKERVIEENERVIEENENE